MTVWRIHIRPTGGLGDPRLSFPLCLGQRVLGVGWAVDWPGDEAPTRDRYFELAEEEYGDGSWKSVLRGLIDKVKCDDLMWTRDPKNVYYLARVAGSWEYRGSKHNREADVVNVRPVEMYEIGLEGCVPGKVIASFRARRTLQRIADSTIEMYSQFVFNQHAKSTIYPGQFGSVDVFSLMGDEDIENVIYVYLQMQGYVVYPTRRKGDTQSYEFEACHKNDRRVAIVQVKTGNMQLELREFGSYLCEVYLFSSTESYIGEQPQNVRILTRAEILDFMKSNQNLLPPAVRNWMEISRQI